MKVLRRAVVKQVLTEKSKTKLYDSFSKEKKRYETECERLDFERRKTLKRSQKNDHPYVASRFQEEIERRKDKIRTLSFKIEQLESLPLGTEIVEREIQFIDEIKVGDRMDNLLAPAEIIVKDGIITEIRM